MGADTKPNSPPPEGVYPPPSGSGPYPAHPGAWPYSAPPNPPFSAAPGAAPLPTPFDAAKSFTGPTGSYPGSAASGPAYPQPVGPGHAYPQPAGPGAAPAYPPPGPTYPPTAGAPPGGVAMGVQAPMPQPIPVYMAQPQPIPGLVVRPPKVQPQPGQVLLGYQVYKGEPGCCQFDGLSQAGILSIIVLVLIFWPLAWLPCLMPECYDDYQCPVYGWPQQMPPGSAPGPYPPGVPTAVPAYPPNPTAH